MPDSAHGFDIMPIIALLAAAAVAVPLFKHAGLDSALGYGARLDLFEAATAQDAKAVFVCVNDKEAATRIAELACAYSSHEFPMTARHRPEKPPLNERSRYGQGYRS